MVDVVVEDVVVEAVVVEVLVLPVDVAPPVSAAAGVASSISDSTDVTPTNAAKPQLRRCGACAEGTWRLAFFDFTGIDSLKVGRTSRWVLDGTMGVVSRSRLRFGSAVETRNDGGGPCGSIQIPGPR